MNIDAKRREAGLSQEKIADILQVDRSTVAKWETGKCMPRAELLPKIAKILGCTVDDLLND